MQRPGVNDCVVNSFHNINLSLNSDTIDQMSERHRFRSLTPLGQLLSFTSQIAGHVLWLDEKGSPENRRYAHPQPVGMCLTSKLAAVSEDIGVGTRKARTYMATCFLKVFFDLILADIRPGPAGSRTWVSSALRMKVSSLA